MRPLILTWLCISTAVFNIQALNLDLTDSKPTTAKPSADLLSSSDLNRSPTKSPAPYAIDDGATTGQQETGSTVKNLIFRLSLNQTGRNDNGQAYGRDGGANATSSDLTKLLDALSGSNNFSSEVMLDERNPGTLNITISNVVGQKDSLNIEASSAESLEEVLNESRSAFNFSSTLKDNHRFAARPQIRSKPSTQVIELTAPITAPPIRQTLDVVAENYTVRKISVEANLFALRLLNQLNIEKLGSHNLVQSPFAVYQGLSLLLSGSMGETTKELDRILLGSQSVHENTKLTHDQDRARLLASFNEIVRQLYSSATNHLLQHQTGDELDAPSSVSHKYNGGSESQHMIIANNLLFSPSAFEISSEFKHLVGSLYNNTALTRIEVGSTESIQVVNDWIRRATAGLIPAILNRKSTFDEFNVMTLLSTSWLSQEWHDSFRKVSSALKSNIRLKGQVEPVDMDKLQSVFVASKISISNNNNAETEPLLEFVDDNKESHFVDYIKSETTRNIHHYHSIINGMVVDVVIIPFKNSNQKLITLTPLQLGSAGNQQPPLALNSTSTSGEVGGSAEQQQHLNLELPDSSQLSKMIATFANDPRRTMRSFWNTVAPDIITRKVYQNMHLALNSSQQQQQRDARAAPASIDNLSIMANSVPPKVRLSMPIIRMDADMSLSAALNHIGIVNSFDPAEANFIGINGHPFNYNKLHLSNVLYKTSFNLNEQGINYDRTIRTLEPMRLSATIKRQQQKQQSSNKNEFLDNQSTSLPEPIDEIKLNRPFVYMICDVKSKLVLYTGVLRNPIKETQFN